MCSHIIVSFAVPSLILGVETNQLFFFGHNPRDLYKVPLAILFGPSTNQGVIDDSMRKAVFQRQSTEFITELYEFGIFAISTLISVYPCTPVDGLPTSCIMVLNDTEMSVLNNTRAEKDGNSDLEKNNPFSSMENIRECWEVFGSNTKFREDNNSPTASESQEKRFGLTDRFVNDLQDQYHRDRAGELHIVGFTGTGPLAALSAAVSRDGRPPRTAYWGAGSHSRMMPFRFCVGMDQDS